MTNQSGSPNYEFLADVQDLETPEQFKAIGDETRQKLLGLLTERAATTSQLAQALGQPKGTVGHHLRVLQRSGLIRVVCTRQVRALTEKYYGRVAREWRASGSPTDVDVTSAMLSQVLSERTLPDGMSTFLLVHSRMSCEDAQQFVNQVQELSREFTQRSSPNDQVYGFLGGIYLTDWPVLELDDRENSDGGHARKR
jgi:DNA-binding transcriptional ArsR family regulator